MLQDTQNKIAKNHPYYKIDFFEKFVQSVASKTNKNFTLYIGNGASSTYLKTNKIFLK